MNATYTAEEKAAAKIAWEKNIEKQNALFDAECAAKEEAVRAAVWADKDPGRAERTLSHFRAVKALHKAAEMEELDLVRIAFA